MNTTIGTCTRVKRSIIQVTGINLLIQIGSLLAVLECLLFTVSVHGATSITPTAGEGDLGTQISRSGNMFSISGGKHIGDSLLHSFDRFNIATGDVAQFRTATLTSDTAIHNILGRVTGNNPSSIFGTIDSATYYPHANLFLINPSGIVFGPAATLNVGGSVSFATADYIRLADGTKDANFYANPAKDSMIAPGFTSILSMSPLIDFGFVTPAAFGFLASTPAAIAVQGSNLSAHNGQSVSFIGGNQKFSYSNPDTSSPASVPSGVTFSGVHLTAKSGQINIASVASPGEVLAATIQPSGSQTLGNISITQGSTLDVSNDKAGTIRIRGGQLEILDSTLSANTSDLDGAKTAVDIKLQGALSIHDTRGQPVITAKSTGDGNSGKVSITASNISATSNSNARFALIDSRSFAEGRAGDVFVTATNTITATNGAVNPNNSLFFIDSGITGSNNGGNISIAARTIHFESISVSTGDLIARSTNQEASGAGGNLTITADRLEATDSRFDTGSFFGQTAGAITLNVREISGTGFEVRALGFGGGGKISLTSDKIFLRDGSVLENDIVSGQGGGIVINTKILELKNGSGLISTTFGNGMAGDIDITATNHVILAGGLADSFPTGLYSNSVGSLGNGNAGSVVITTPKLEMSNGARINTVTEGSGSGGNVTLNITGDLSISGEFPFNLVEPIFEVGTLGPSGIFTKTRGSELCTSSCGNAGNISIKARSLTLGPGAQIDSGTTNNGSGGAISIQLRDSLSLSGTLNDGSPVGIFSRTTGTTSDSGSGGNILLTAGRSVSISNGAEISASSTGPGNAGNVLINAGRQFEMRNGSVSTQADQASGGNIDIRAIDRIRLRDSRISSSVQGGPGTTGGNISIDPKVVILQNSQVLAQAVKGNGGNITITTPLFLADQSSLIDASSQFGLNGSVTIQSPISNLSGTVGQLASKPSQAHVLVQSQCAALANGLQSSFIVAGRQALPTEPGGWLGSSVLMAMGTSMSPDIMAERPGEEQSFTFGTETLSLRRFTPPGFLVRSFAVDGSTGCRS